jgi:hypothetical protein
LASQELGELGDGTSSPVRLEWRWYYHLLSLGFWGLVVFPLVLVRENRRWPAWTIVLPLLAILVVCRMIATPSFLPLATAEMFHAFVMTLATGWAIVWLLGPWFAGRSGFMTFLSALSVLMAVGLLSYAGHCGLAYTKGLLPLTISYATAVLALLLSVTLSSRFCRETYSPRRFMAWLVLWTMLTTVAGMFVLAVCLGLAEAVQGGVQSVVMLASVLFFATFGGVFAGGLLYVLQLPFLFLAFRNPFYRERFCRVLRLPARDVTVCDVFLAEPVPDGSNPT